MTKFWSAVLCATGYGGLVLLGTCCLAIGLRAQSGRATILGRVTDATSRAIPGTQVTAVHDDTKAIAETRSANDGTYSLINLPIGSYTIEFGRDGFRSVVIRVVVGVQSTLTRDATLAIGERSDVVTVSGSPGLVDSTVSGVGSTLQRSIVANLPLSIAGGRSIENFAYATAPGVEGNNWMSNVVGGAPFSKEVVLDGTSATIQIQGHISESSPPLEAVEEYRVQTSGMSAEYGRTGGGIFNFSLRSGTNTLHGSGYGQLRHESLNANTWMNTLLARANPGQASAYATPRDRQRVTGASVGGPLFRNRTFVFGAVEHYQQNRRQLGAYDRTVPTDAFLAGDFSALLDTSTDLGSDAAGNPIYRGSILDPRSGIVFPGNVIPADRISPVSRRIVDLYREAYRPLLAGRLTNNSAGLAHVDPSFAQYQVSLKADHIVSIRSRLSGSLIVTKRPRTLADQGGVWDARQDEGGPLSKARRHEVSTYQGRFSHSYTLSSSLLHVGSATFSRFRNPNTSHSAGGGWPERLGLDVPGTYDSFPQINFGDAINGVDLTDIGLGTSNVYVANTYQLNDSLTWASGAHLVKIGADVRVIQMDSHGDRPFLEYNFSPAQTGRLGGPIANQIGFGFASFLLGEVASASQHVPADLYGSRNYIAAFVQDDFRLSDSLTLNLGLRWESTGGWTERHGRWSNFNTSKLNPVTGRPGVLEFADETDGSFEGRRRFNQFGPRAGLAYANGQTVYRAAYGLFYAPIGVNFWAGVPYGFAPGFVGVNRVNPTSDGSAAFNWDAAPYPGGLTPATKDPALAQWGMVSVSPDSLRAGRIQQWNAGVERELGSGFALAVNYVGNRASGLPTGDLERNQPDPAVMKTLLLEGKEWNWVADAESAAAAGVTYPYPGFAGPAWMAITPYPQAAAGWGPLFHVGSPLGRSDYHALMVTTTARSRGGVSAALSYTLSRQRGNVETAFQERWTPGAIQDVTRRDDEARVIGANDRTHVAKGYVSWSLPFGRGRRFLNDATGPVRALVSGWTVSGIFRYESGLPLAIRSSNSYAGWHYPIYVDRRPGVPVDGAFEPGAFNPADPVQTGNEYFNPAAFANPAYGDLGTGPGRFADLRGFGAAYEDLAVLKNFALGSSQVQLRVELFNLFNRRYFADPDTNIASPSFGHVTGTGWQPPRQSQIGLRVEW